MPSKPTFKEFVHAIELIRSGQRGREELNSFLRLANETLQQDPDIYFTESYHTGSTL